MKIRLAPILIALAAPILAGFTHTALSKETVPATFISVEHRLPLVLVGDDETISSTHVANTADLNSPPGQFTSSRQELTATYSLGSVNGTEFAATLRQFVYNAHTEAIIESSDRSITVTANAHTQKLVIDLIAAIDGASGK